MALVNQALFERIDDEWVKAERRRGLEVLKAGQNPLWIPACAGMTLYRFILR